MFWIDSGQVLWVNYQLQHKQLFSYYQDLILHVVELSDLESFEKYWAKPSKVLSGFQSLRCCQVLGILQNPADPLDLSDDGITALEAPLAGQISKSMNTWNSQQWVFRILKVLMVLWICLTMDSIHCIFFPKKLQAKAVTAFAHFTQI